MKTREIKFRGWDGQCMMTPHFIDEFGGWYIQDRDVEDGRPCKGPLMQWTGLKDKNGVDIYESDICLKHWSKEIYGDREPMIGVIKWVDFGGRYTHESNGLKGHKYYNELHENLIYPEYPRSLFEVIGNIYENSELLNETIERETPH